MFRMHSVTLPPPCLSAACCRHCRGLVEWSLGPRVSSFCGRGCSERFRSNHHRLSFRLSFLQMPLASRRCSSILRSASPGSRYPPCHTSTPLSYPVSSSSALWSVTAVPAGPRSRWSRCWTGWRRLLPSPPLQTIPPCQWTLVCMAPGADRTGEAVRALLDDRPSHFTHFRRSIPPLPFFSLVLGAASCPS